MPTGETEGDKKWRRLQLWWKSKQLATAYDELTQPREQRYTEDEKNQILAKWSVERHEYDAYVQQRETEDNERWKDQCLSMAYHYLTKIHFPTYPEDEKNKILAQFFIEPHEYDVYAQGRQEAEAQARKEAERHEIEERKRRENDPRYWKRLYEIMVEQEFRRKREWEGYLGLLIISLCIAAVWFVFHLVGIMFHRSF